jgi:cephalosporin-C deacetylase-like acetyl esterase
MRRVLLLALALGALASPASAPGAAAPQELTITASDGAKLACTLIEPLGAPPAGGWPAVMLFHGLGGTRQDMVPLGLRLATAFASLMCDARGNGQSGGLFGLDGPRDVQDTEELCE